MIKNTKKNRKLKVLLYCVIVNEIYFMTNIAKLPQVIFIVYIGEIKMLMTDNKKI